MGFYRRLKKGDYIHFGDGYPFLVKAISYYNKTADIVYMLRDGRSGFCSLKDVKGGI